MAKNHTGELPECTPTNITGVSLSFTGRRWRGCGNTGIDLKSSFAGREHDIHQSTHHLGKIGCMHTEVKETSKKQSILNYKKLYAVRARPQGVEYLIVQKSEEDG